MFFKRREGQCLFPSEQGWVIAVSLIFAHPLKLPARDCVFNTQMYFSRYADIQWEGQSYWSGQSGKVYSFNTEGCCSLRREHLCFAWAEKASRYSKDAVNWELIWSECRYAEEASKSWKSYTDVRLPEILRWNLSVLLDLLLECDNHFILITMNWKNFPKIYRKL